MQTPRYLAAALVLCASLAACGGGGGGGGPQPTTTSTTVPTPSTAPPSVTASGLLVDHESGSPIAGMYVGLAPDTVGATPVPQPTTDSSGKFTVTANAAGTYLLVIGDGANNRPVIHDLVTLTAGANTLVAPSIGPAPGATANPIEHSGNFRLTTLTAAEQACLAYENQKRTGVALQPVASDEWLTEDNRGYWTVSTANNSFTAYPSVLGYTSGDGLGASCQAMIDGDFSLNVWDTLPNLLWYTGDSGGTHNVATSEGMVDPRMSSYPTPKPNPWP